MKPADVINLLKSQLTRNLTLVLGGNFFAAGLGFLSVILISRSITVSDFGLFNMALSIILIAPHLASLGMDTSMIKFASSYLGSGKTAEAIEVFRETLLVRVISSSVIAIVIFGTAPILSNKIFHYPNLTPLIRLSVFGILSVALFSYVKSVLYAYKLFKKFVILQVAVDFTKLFTVGVLIFYLKMTVFIAVGLFALAPLLGAFLGFKQISHKLSSKRKPIKGLLKDLLSYSKWTFICTACDRIFPYVAIFLIVKMLSSKSAGIYGLALNLTYIFPILMFSLKTVLLPEVSRFKEIAQFEKYVKASLKTSLYIGIMVIPVLFFSRRIILFFFGPRYFDSVIIFNWLLLSYVFRMVGTAIRSALYSMNKPHILAIVNLLTLIAMISGCYIFIPHFGILAPAVLAFVINVITMGFLIIYIFKHIHRGKLIFKDEVIYEPFGS